MSMSPQRCNSVALSPCFELKYSICETDLDCIHRTCLFYICVLLVPLFWVVSICVLDVCIVFVCHRGFIWFLSTDLTVFVLLKCYCREANNLEGFYSEK